VQWLSLGAASSQSLQDGENQTGSKLSITEAVPSTFERQDSNEFDPIDEATLGRKSNQSPR
jgi:hypothetical protein